MFSVRLRGTVDFVLMVTGDRLVVVSDSNTLLAHETMSQLLASVAFIEAFLHGEATIEVVLAVLARGHIVLEETDLCDACLTVDTPRIPTQLTFFELALSYGRQFEVLGVLADDLGGGVPVSDLGVLGH